MRLLDEKETASILAVSPIVLRKLRCVGAAENGMPEVPYIRMGRRIRYLDSDVQAYIERLREEGAANA